MKIIIMKLYNKQKPQKGFLMVQEIIKKAKNLMILKKK